MDSLDSPRSPKRRRILASMNATYAADQDLGRKIHQTPASASAISPPQPGPSRTPDPECPRGNISAEPSGAADQDPRTRQTSEPRASKVRFKSPSRRGHRGRHEDDDGYRRRRRDHDHDRDHDRDRHQDRDQDPDGEGTREKDGDRSSRHKHRRHRSRSRSRSRSPTSSSHRHRSHRHHHRRKRRHHSPKAKEPTEPEHEPQDPFVEEPLDPEEAFRQSLFDAMADDEGAAYWEGVYGQPIHIYSSDRVNPQGELERMTDEEYAAHVRQKMWEKTHAGLVEEREKRKKLAAEQAKERIRKQEEDMRIHIELERSLRRGEKRKARKIWRERWDAYVDAWSQWDGKSVEGIPWPVKKSAEEGDGKGEIDPAAVRAFFVNGLNLEEVGEKEFATKLKDERVRWHPDKFQQKLGGTVEGGVMRDVTAIFQAIDALWNDTRKNT